MGAEVATADMADMADMEDTVAGITTAIMVAMITGDMDGTMAIIGVIIMAGTIAGVGAMDGEVLDGVGEMNGPRTRSSSKQHPLRCMRKQRQRPL